MDNLLLLCACLASYGGFACLALAMPEHWERAGFDPSAQPRAGPPLRLGGAVLLTAAAFLCMVRDGAGFGVLLWVQLMTAGAIGVAFTLTWRPRALGRLLLLRRSN